MEEEVAWAPSSGLSQPCGGAREQVLPVEGPSPWEVAGRRTLPCRATIRAFLGRVRPHVGKLSATGSDPDAEH